MKEKKNANQGFIEICNTDIYHKTREKLSTGSFEIVEDEKWHKVELKGKHLGGTAYIKPDTTLPIRNDEVLDEQQQITREIIEVLIKRGDLTADVLDIIVAKWLKNAKHHEAMIEITVDEILEARGIMKKVNSCGRRGGFTEIQRKEIQKQIDALSYVWIKVYEMDTIQIIEGKRKREKWVGESRAIVLSSRIGKVRGDGRTDTYAWRVRPGDVFAKFLFDVGRQTALLSQKALNYDPIRQKWEKRLTRSFAWLWRISRSRTQEGLLVKTLIEYAGMVIEKGRPKRTRDRLEKALNRLQVDGVITTWEYAMADTLTFKDGWWKKWLEQKVIITAPPEITEQYKKIKRKRKK